MSQSRLKRPARVVPCLARKSVQFSSVSSRSLHAHSTSRNYTSERGGGVRARAHACVALGRCVAFGRPKMSVWGHTGAGSPSSKVAYISFLRPLFGTYLMFRFRFFGFRRRRRRLCLHTTTPHGAHTLHGGPRSRTGRTKALAVTLARCRPAPVAHHACLWNGL